MSNQKLSDLVENRLAQNPDSVAFFINNCPIHVSDFHLRILATVQWLKKENIGQGDVVAVWMVNRLEWFVMLFAAARIGAVIISVNTRYRSEELLHILQSSGARYLVTQSNYKRIDFLGILGTLSRSQIPALEKIILVSEQNWGAQDWGAQDSAIHNVVTPSLAWPVIHFSPSGAFASERTGTQVSIDVPDESDPEALVILFPTSGTTKAPKLVMHPQRTLTDHARRCAAAYDLVAHDASLLTMLPVCGVFGLNASLAALAGGAPVVLQESFEAAEAGKLISKYNITHTFGSDEMFNRLCEVFVQEIPFPSLRLCGFGAFTSSFSDSAKECWRRGLPLHGMYGSSEVLAIFSGQPSDLSLEQKIEGGGRPVAGNEANVRIRDTHTGELLPEGQSGEIEIQAPSQFMGYFRNDQETARAHRDGYFVTGDLGHLRPDGTLVYETRLGDAMRLGGHLVNPVEIEEVLKQMPAVQDAHVVHTTIAGQPRAVAFVIPQPGQQPDVETITVNLKSKIASYKVPVRLWIVSDFPQTEGANGLKTSRVKLREMALTRIAAETST